MTKITISNQSRKSKRKYKSENGSTRTSEYIRGGIRCHGGVSIPCWPYILLFWLSGSWQEDFKMTQPYFCISMIISPWKRTWPFLWTIFNSHQLRIFCTKFDWNLHACCGEDWLIDYLRFYVPLKNFSLIWRRHHCRWRAAQFRPMIGAQGLWAGMDLYRAKPAVTRDLGFSGLIRRTVPFSRLSRHTRGCGWSILTRILTGLLEKKIVFYVNICEYGFPYCGPSRPQRTMIWTTLNLHYIRKLSCKY
jgi:hypothetical protein